MNTMNMPGFTADLSLNKLRGCYAMTSRGAVARGGVVVGQQFGSIDFPVSYLELDCGDRCCGSGQRPPLCGVYSVSLLVGSDNRTFLGYVSLPENCAWNPCIN